MIVRLAIRRSRASRAGLHGGFRVTKPQRVHQRSRTDHRFPAPQVGSGARLRPAQGPVGLSRQPHRGAFQYECRDHNGQWWRSYGKELWEFSEDGLMRRREASINDVQIHESERRIYGSPPGGRARRLAPDPVVPRLLTTQSRPRQQSGPWRDRLIASAARRRLD